MCWGFWGPFRAKDPDPTPLASWPSHYSKRKAEQIQEKQFLVVGEGWGRVGGGPSTFKISPPHVGPRCKRDSAIYIYVWGIRIYMYIERENDIGPIGYMDM